MSFLTDLYLRKGWSLRRISSELGCSKTTVRKKLIEAGIELNDQSGSDLRSLKNKLRQRGLSDQAIGDLFNLWKVSARRGESKWYGKMVREVLGK